MRNKKTKEQYRDEYEEKSIYSEDIWTTYPNMKNSCIKLFSKRNEKSQSLMHLKEYKNDYGLKIRGKRLNGLANPWDDYSAYVYKKAKSWKHNSKRRKQNYK